MIEPDSEQIEDISTPPTEPQVEPIEDIATESWTELSLLRIENLIVSNENFVLG